MSDLSVALQASVARKSRLTIAVHWLSAAAVLSAFTLAWLREQVESDALGATLLAWHRQFGLLVLLLLAVRLFERWRWVAHDELEKLPLPLHLAAVVTHWLIYALLLAMPLLGWAMTNAQGHAVQLWQAIALPTFVSVDPDLADSLQEWHERCAWAMLAMVGLHALAALWHHYFRRDGVLASMLPWVRRR
ncbi:MAG: hypothetical protein RJA36_3496 [Pseudomonadota bacterium]|jgi:cytochrome b561